MNIQSDFSLKQLNTFGLNQKAKYFSTFESIDELKDCITWAKNQNTTPYILGGGSNILLTKDLDCLVLHNTIKGKRVVEESDDHIILEIGGGEVWHDLVMFSIQNGWSGIENLALIPGRVGAAPIQNIGAYGVELKDVFHSLDFLHFEKDNLQKFEAKECKFGYRDSVFKGPLKGKGVIVSVRLKLNKTFSPNISYGAIQSELESMGKKSARAADVAEAVIRIRSSKLPDPKKIGNSGSFFKNPVISTSLLEGIKAKDPNIPAYPVNEKSVKVAAGYLIEKAGFKGFRKGDAGMHEKQALVLVNHGDAKGIELVEMAEMVQEAVFKKFSIKLEPEVNIL